jgi:hypothetical protein
VTHLLEAVPKEYGCRPKGRVKILIVAGLLSAPDELKTKSPASFLRAQNSDPGEDVGQIQSPL